MCPMNRSWNKCRCSVVNCSAIKSMMQTISTIDMDFWWYFFWFELRNLFDFKVVFSFSISKCAYLFRVVGTFSFQLFQLLTNYFCLCFHFGWLLLVLVRHFQSIFKQKNRTTDEPISIANGNQSKTKMQNCWNFTVLIFTKTSIWTIVNDLFHTLYLNSSQKTQ